MSNAESARILLSKRLEIRSRLTHRMRSNISQQRGAQKPEIPDRLYFRIGDVARLCSVQPYVLRFWESEFSQLRPNKSGTGQRLYRKRDVEIALRIKRLLYDEGYTIAGARQVVQAELRKKAGQPELPLQQHQAAEGAEVRLHKVRRELREILGLLSTPEPQITQPPREKKSASTRIDRPELFEP